MLATEAKALHQRGVIQVVGGVQQRLGALECGTQLADVPALDNGDAVLQHLRACAATARAGSARH